MRAATVLAVRCAGAPVGGLVVGDQQHGVDLLGVFDVEPLAARAGVVGRIERTLPALGTDTALPAVAEASVRTYRGPAPQAYGPGLFLVRPDGCIGWAGEAPAGLAAYAEPLGLDLTSA
ncbi:MULTISPECIES: hypothetical protein [unclassified Streptomyces]|uniref:hypothetical protein n=1 Tax=unclassified Streptomyces TaxID=2593676 RepID=UPI000CD5527D|nr:MULTISPECIES: hypothetical protein [unclassified Streptomyces]